MHTHYVIMRTHHTFQTYTFADKSQHRDTHTQPVNLHTHNKYMHARLEATRQAQHTQTDTCVEKEPCPRFSRNNLMLHLWSSWPLSRLHKSLTGRRVQPCTDNRSHTQVGCIHIYSPVSPMLLCFHGLVPKGFVRTYLYFWSVKQDFGSSLKEQCRLS